MDDRVNCERRFALARSLLFSGRYHCRSRSLARRSIVSLHQVERGLRSRNLIQIELELEAKSERGEEDQRDREERRLASERVR